MKDRPAAVFTGNTYMTIGLFDAVEAPGLDGPENIAGVGSDKSDAIKEKDHGCTSHQF